MMTEEDVRVLLVTGAASGIEHAVALRLAASGQCLAMLRSDPVAARASA